MNVVVVQAKSLRFNGCYVTSYFLHMNKQSTSMKMWLGSAKSRLLRIMV